MASTLTCPAEKVDWPAQRAGCAQREDDALATAQAAWERAIEATENCFGRLTWLSSRCNRDADQYEHLAFASLISLEAASEIVRESHRRAFQAWLCLSLEAQHKQVVEYLSSLDPHACEQLKKGLMTLVPSSASIAERELFRVDTEFILCLAENETVAASRGVQFGWLDVPVGK